MSDICVKVERLSKRFLVFKSQKTVLRTLRLLIKRESFKKELWVLRDLSFELKKGERVAIIGKNGSGKTTLLRILTGIYDKTFGYISVEEEPKSLFNSWIGFNGDLSVIDNVYLFGAIHGIERKILKQNMGNILKMAELYHLCFSPLKELSTGQQQRLAFSVFLQNTSDFFIFDESLAFVDQAFAQECDAYLQNLFSSDKTVIITSHNAAFLKRHCKTALWLDEGRIRKQGEIEEVIGEYERSFSG